MNRQPQSARVFSASPELDWLKILHDARRQTDTTSDEWQFLVDAVRHVLRNERTIARERLNGDWRETAAYPFERELPAPTSLPKAA